MLVNAALVVLAFGLLGLVIWRNREKIHEVFGRPLDWRLLAAAEAIYLSALVSTFVRWYLLVRVVDPPFHAPGAPCCSASSATSSTW